jgi:hypothetical protein
VTLVVGAGGCRCGVDMLAPEVLASASVRDRLVEDGDALGEEFGVARALRHVEY